VRSCGSLRIGTCSSSQIAGNCNLAQLGAISCKQMQLSAISRGREEERRNLQKQTKVTKRGYARAAVTPGLPGTMHAARNWTAISLFTFFTVAGTGRRAATRSSI
jgi:hypothetical protein